MMFSTPIIVASSNIDKIRELKVVASDFAIELLAPESFSSQNLKNEIPTVEEVGVSYLENAALKARAYSAWSGCFALGDDSGLEVVALDNRPGLFSARYAGVGASDKDKMDKVLSELEELERISGPVVRTAFFRCALVLVSPNGLHWQAEYSMQGQVLREPRGKKGFGYDPIILIDGLGVTLAELDFAQTCKIGFRACAARELFQKFLAGVS
jgi:XTP/dITP diphosphohydrolase